MTSPLASLDEKLLTFVVCGTTFKSSSCVVCVFGVPVPGPLSSLRPRESVFVPHQESRESPPPPPPPPHDAILRHNLSNVS